MHVCGGWQQLVGVGEETLAAIFGRGSAGDIPLSVYAFFPSFPSTFLGVAPCRRPIGPEGGGAKISFVWGRYVRKTRNAGVFLDSPGRTKFAERVAGKCSEFSSRNWHQYKIACVVHTFHNY